LSAAFDKTESAVALQRLVRQHLYYAWRWQLQWIRGIENARGVPWIETRKFNGLNAFPFPGAGEPGTDPGHGAPRWRRICRGYENCG
jgi:hypothetical protein